MSQLPSTLSSPPHASASSSKQAALDPVSITGQELHGFPQSTLPQSRSRFELFFESFFREENIKWMSVIGATIVLASSLMLVTRQWSNWPDWMKYLTILSYSCVIYISSSVARSRFGLGTTSIVLKFLTLLLIPLCFIALSWVHRGDLMPGKLALTSLLMLPALGFMYFAAKQIFESLLGESQPTFTWSYMLLCLGGALPAVTDVSAAMALSAGCWMVMTIGSIKVNRHIFWLMEEHHRPRVFAFFPIALLGLQFLAIMAMKTLKVLPIQWLGLGLVMIAATMLLTARIVAEVFRARTGNLVRPLPWNIMVPLVAGLALVVTGVVLSAAGFSFIGPTTVALIPTTIVAASLMFIVAWDTGHKGFVWAGLILFCVAYQSSPVLLTELVQQVKQTAAVVVHEEKLPVAFYGITYLPLIVILCVTYRITGALRYRRGYERLAVYSGPAKQFATILTVALFALAVANLKAIAMIAALDVLLLAVMAVTFQDRRYAYAAIASLVVSSLTCVPLANAMQWAQISFWHFLTPPAILSLLLVSLPGIDRLLMRLPVVNSNGSTNRASLPRTDNFAVCFFTGYAVAALITLMWIPLAFNSNIPGLEPPTRGVFLSVEAAIQLGLALISFLICTLRNQSYLCAMSFWLAGAAMITHAITSNAIAPMLVLQWLSIASAAISMTAFAAVIRLSRVIAPTAWQLIRSTQLSDFRVFRPTVSPTTADDSTIITAELVWSGQSRAATALLVSLSDLSMTCATCLAVLYHLPTLVLASYSLPLAMPLATVSVAAWSVVISVLVRNRSLSVLAAGVLPLFSPALLLTYKPELYEASVCALAALGVSGTVLLLTAHRQHVSLKSMSLVSLAWVTSLMALSCLHADALPRLIGCTGALVLIVAYRRWDDPIATALTAVMINLQLGLGIISLCGTRGWLVTWAEQSEFFVGLSALFPYVALSSLLFDFNTPRLSHEIREIWQRLLWGFSLILACTTFSIYPSSLFVVGCILTGFALLAVGQYRAAVCRQSEWFVWTGTVALVVMVLWLRASGMITLGADYFALVVLSVIALCFHRLTLDQGSFAVFARPMQQIGLGCPGLLTLLALGRHLALPMTNVEPLGLLALFAAAMIYFYYGLNTHSRLYTLLALAIVNVTLCLTWQDFQIHDPQFYCVPIGFSIIAFVQLLKAELPKASHNPLRYIGALVVLVSPTFMMLRGGSWWDIISLLVLCIVVILLAIGLRLSALVYTGTAFLMADLVMMVVQSTMDHPSLLWVCGLGLGVAVLSLAAYCERHREHILSRIRVLSAELAAWN